MDKLQNVLDFLGNYITLQNLTFILGLIGSIGTATNVINSRKNLKLKLRFWGTNQNKKISLAYVQFENKSNSPILITDVDLVIGNSSYPCQKLPTIAETSMHKIGKELSIHDFYNLPFPIQLVGLGGTSGYLVFDIPQCAELSLSNPVLLRVSTNRGRSKKYKLLPDQECSE